MSNIVIASNDPLCQSAQKYFIAHQKCIAGPPIASLQNGETLYVIAHDTELTDGTAFVDNILKYGIPATNFSIVLIVCSAASMKFEKELLTPAERIANGFKRTVRASTTIVTGLWDMNTGNANFVGNYIDVKPGDDITSMMSRLSIN